MYSRPKKPPPHLHPPPTPLMSRSRRRHGFFSVLLRTCHVPPVFLVGVLPRGKRVTALVLIATPTRHRETKEITPQDTTQGMDPEPRTGKRLFKVKGCVRWCARRASLRPYPYASRFHAGRQKRERERERRRAQNGAKKRGSVSFLSIFGARRSPHRQAPQLPKKP